MEKIILKERKLEMVCTFNIKTAFMQEILNVKKLTSGGTGDTLATILAIIVIIFIIIRFIDISYSANYAQTECQFRYCGTAIPFLTVRSTAR